MIAALLYAVMNQSKYGMSYRDVVNLSLVLAVSSKFH